MLRELSTSTAISGRMMVTSSFCSCGWMRMKSRTTRASSLNVAEIASRPLDLSPTHKLQPISARTAATIADSTGPGSTG